MLKKIHRWGFVLLFGILLLAAWSLLRSGITSQTPPPPSSRFDGERAWEDVAAQCRMGPRTPGSAAHAEVRAWIRDELEAAGWEVEEIPAEMLGHKIYNIYAHRGETPPRILFGAHYDSRLHADEDPDPAKRLVGMPGANDGASGVAVLLEMARVLPAEERGVGFVFFDAEDSGNIEGWDWLLGSRAFADSIWWHPDAFILLDMVGDADLNIYQERNSDPTLTRQIWDAAAKAGYEESFIPQPKYRMLDDHVPFLKLGIPSVDIIDFDYAYWHTAADTPDKVSAQSLQIVGTTMLRWLESQK